jgi:hypothetical protein
MDYYKLSVINFFERTILLSILAYVLGMYIEKSIIKISKTWKYEQFYLGCIQFIINIFILYIIEIHIFNNFSYELNYTTPGLFFVAIFFGIQLNMYKLLYKE